MMEQLTEHFNLQEFVVSSTARKMGIDNTPTPIAVASLRILASELEKVRNDYGKPMVVTSGYRCQRLNKAVGGKSNSQHLKGEAADIIADDLRALFDVVIRYDFDQVLFERAKDGTRWLHVSRKAVGNRHQFIKEYKV